MFLLLSRKMQIAVFSLSLATTSGVSAKSVSKNPETSKHSPSNSEVEKCGEPNEVIPQIFLREFEMKNSERKNVNLQYHFGSTPRLISATHPDLCNARGCESSLFVAGDGCVKLVLNFFGKLEPVANSGTSFRKILITTRQLAVDGGGLVRKYYEFKTDTTEYLETRK